MAILLLLSILMSGGAAIGAEKSLPGDILYPVKINVNEEVHGWFAISDEAKADWEVERTHRRLEEAEALAAKGELSADVRAKIEANFESQSQRVKDRIEKFKNKENFNAAVDVGSNFETALRAHDRILSKLAETASSSDSQEEIAPIVVKVRSQAKAARKEREKNEDSVSAKMYVGIEAAAEGKLKAAENKVAEVRKFFTSIKADIDAGTGAEAEARLKLAEDSIVAGKAKLEAKAYGDAFVLFQKAISISQQAKLIVTARQELNIDVQVGGDSSGDNEIEGELNLKIEGGSVQGRSRLKANLGL